MSQLTDALNRIQTWLVNNYPIVAEDIAPGLNQEEIRSIIEMIPFPLSDEVYELYQWSSGHDNSAFTIYTSIFDPYDGMSHVSLQYAIELKSILEEVDAEVCVTKYMSKPLFPLFEYEVVQFCAIGDWEDKKSSPIIFVSDSYEIITRYTSLTSMMLTVAESFESGAFSLDEEGYTEWNTAVFSPIYIKNNSDILKVSVKRLKQELITGKGNDTFLDMTIKNFKGDIYYLNRERKNATNNQLDTEIFQPLISAMQDENENEIVRDLARQALEELNYNFEHG
jgi:hypothetical protein